MVAVLLDEFLMAMGSARNARQEAVAFAKANLMDLQEGAKTGANVTVTIADEAVEKVRFHPMIVQTIYVAVPWEESFRLWDRGSARPVSH